MHSGLDILHTLLPFLPPPSLHPRSLELFVVLVSMCGRVGGGGEGGGVGWVKGKGTGKGKVMSGI